MSLETAKNAVDFLIKNAHEEGVVPQVTFFGGEPTLLWDEIIVPTVNYVHHELNENFSFNITSNCVLMTEDRLKWMKQEGVGLLFSIDGDKATQDYNRRSHGGLGSFDSIRDIISIIPNYFPNTIFRSTVIPATCQHVFENIMFASQSGYKNVYLVPDVFQPWDDAHKETLRHQLTLYGDYYINSYRNGSERVKLAPFEKAFGKIWRIMHTTEHRATRNCIADGKCGFCTNGHGAIDAHGNIYACQELPSSKGTEDIFYIGNLTDGIDDERRQVLIDTFDIQKVSGLDCSACALNNICDGGCVANNYLISGNPNKVPHMYCCWNKLLIEEAIRVANILGDEKNNAFKASFVAFVKDGGYGL